LIAVAQRPAAAQVGDQAQGRKRAALVAERDIHPAVVIAFLRAAVQRPARRLSPAMLSPARRRSAGSNSALCTVSVDAIFTVGGPLEP
jgi:hypothetical protein